MKPASGESAIGAHSPDNLAWPSSASVERWRDALFHIIGCSPIEISSRLELLLRFCADHSVSPDSLIGECRVHPDRAARLGFYLGAARTSGANLIVRSFLIHNGINVFGDLVCMPSTAETIWREQGEQWI
jgi:hypothetical protein